MATLVVGPDTTTCSECGEAAVVSDAVHACGARFTSILNKRGPMDEEKVIRMRRDLPLVQAPEIHSVDAG